ncbi:hypothetical protein GH714_034744 [Hevea brasiliensis]|uniref:Pectin acetylesterase n=1 Tax=Hevea brasiliensis TaxID=3981 RepID=A0A6A6KK42_HEVBR|nr:hypothetical protein GH714_034744 [Hevea brasiliensis]
MIKPLGYVPDIGAVLHDVEDEQKDHYLSYHSEKLAIAYGLMKTPPEAPIIVVKNLRMCDDYHLAVKLISKAANRMIIVRDTNGFHHFQEGLLRSQQPPWQFEDIVLVGAPKSMILYFFNWKRVKLRYCDGASFSGDSKNEMNTSAIYQDVFNLKSVNVKRMQTDFNPSIN